MKAKISCYTPGQLLSGIHFFILNKGHNSGKPLDNPKANCFIFQVETINDRDRYFYLAWALWKAGGFRPYLVGSVIEFIRKDDFIRAMELAEVATNAQRERFTESVSQLCDLEAKAAVYKKFVDSAIIAKRTSLAHLLRL